MSEQIHYSEGEPEKMASDIGQRSGLSDEAVGLHAANLALRDGRYGGNRVPTFADLDPATRDRYLAQAKRDLLPVLEMEAPRLRREERDRIMGLLQRAEVGTAASLAAVGYRKRQAEAPPSPEADIGPYVLKAAWETLVTLDSAPANPKT